MVWKYFITKLYFLIFLVNLGRSFSVQHCSPMIPRMLRHYLDRNWLQGLCHPLHLPHKSDAVMERAAMETNFWALLGIEPGTLRTRVKDLNHCATLLLYLLMQFSPYYSHWHIHQAPHWDLLGFCAWIYKTNHIHIINPTSYTTDDKTTSPLNVHGCVKKHCTKANIKPQLYRFLNSKFSFVHFVFSVFFPFSQISSEYTKM